MTNWMYYLILLLLTAKSGDSSAFTLDQILEKARKSSPRIEQANYQLKSKLAEANQVNAAFDSTVFAKYEKADDKTMQNSTFAGDRRTQRGYQVGIRRFFGTGTKLELSWEQSRAENLYNSTEVSSATVTPTSNNFDPANSTAYEINLSQELWRNFWAREVRLQEQMMLTAAESQRYQNKLLKQQIQVETESLYWNLILIKEQMAIAQKLVNRAKKFSKQMSRRVEVGRADRVDEAAAASQVIAQEDSLIELDIMKDNLLKRLEMNIDPTGGTKLTLDQLDTPLSKSFHTLPATDTTAGFELGKKQRLDLAIVTGQQKTTELKRDFAKEQGRPSISLFGRYKQNGMDVSSSDAYKEAVKSRHPLVAFGIELEMSIGNTKSASGVIAATEEMAGLSSQRQLILSNFRRDLAIAFTELNGANRRFRQAEKKIKTFQQKQRREQAKLKQARSDQVSVIRYEMEVLVAKNEKYLAQKRMRDSESQIKYLLHAYPME